MLSFRLSTILCSLLTIMVLVLSFSATPAMAHCDGVKHGDGHPHCTGGEPPAPEPQVLVVRDAEGTLMGMVTSIDDAFVNFALEADPSLAAYFETFPVIWLRAAHDGFDLTDTRFSITHPISFSDLNCKGTPYYSGGVPKRFNLPFLSGEEVEGGQIVYVPTDPAEPQIATVVKSVLTGAFPYDCRNTGGTGEPKVQATAVNFSFVPPYAIGF